MTDFVDDPVVIVSAARTPMAAFQGDFAGVTAPQLGAVAIRAAVERAGLKPEQIEEAVLPIPRPRLRLPIRARNRGARRVPVGRARATLHLRSGRAVGWFSARNRGTIRRKCPRASSASLCLRRSVPGFLPVTCWWPRRLRWRLRKPKISSPF